LLSSGREGWQGSECGQPGVDVRATKWYNSYTNEVRLRSTQEPEVEEESQTGDCFEEAREIFTRPYYQDQRSDLPEQYRAIGWVETSSIR